MRGVAAIGLFALVGCYSPTPPQNVPCVDDEHCPSSQKCIAGFCGGSSGIDGGATDAMADAPALPLCELWTATHFDPCTIPAPTGDLDLGTALSGYTLDTDKPELKGKMGTIIP